jgi:hypothetical protein
VSDTPRCDERTVYNEHGEWVNSSFARLLERELNTMHSRLVRDGVEIERLNDRIKRLEEAGDAMAYEGWNEPYLSLAWRKAKEAKP